jgi:hypothetical protein
MKSTGFACTTTSNNIPFATEERGRYKFDVLVDVVNQCEQNQVTNNAQCISSAACEPLFQ